MSGILNEVNWPNDWHAIPFGRLVARRKDVGGATLPPLSVFLDEGVVPRSSREDNFNRLGADLSQYLVVEPGDLVFNKLRTWQGAIGVSEQSGIVSPAYFVCRPQQDLFPRFAHYALRSTPYLQELTRVSKWMPPSQFDIAWDDLRDVVMTVPPLEEQRAIADYLDAETARLDGLIGWRSAQLAALRERLASEVERRVLGFLGASERTSQPSPFFQTRPIDWRETNLRHLGFEVQTGPFGSQLHAEEYVEGGTPIINPMHLVDGTIVPSNTMTVAEDKRTELSRHSLEVGDVVVARRGELGRVAVVDEASTGYLCGTGSLRLRPVRSLLRSGYLSMLLSSAPLRAYFDTASVGSTMDNLSAETLLAAPALVPPFSEQEGIEAAVEAARRRAGAAIGLMTSQIELLSERRQALITAAVTGQLAISGVGA